MSRNDPFGFDISAASDKKRRLKNRRGMSGAFETSSRPCDHAGCEAAGQYRAPKSPETLDSFYWFCRDHVREYNLKWNFFQGSSEEEFQKFIDRDRVWGRETKPFGNRTEDSAWARLGIEDPMEILGDKASRTPAACPRDASCPRPSGARWRYWRRGKAGRAPKSASSTRAW